MGSLIEIFEINTSLKDIISNDMICLKCVYVTMTFILNLTSSIQCHETTFSSTFGIKNKNKL